MRTWPLVIEPQADLEVESAFGWYEAQRPGLGSAFRSELRAAYDRITEGPLKYQASRSGIRHTMLRRFPYAVYFAVEGDTVVVVAVLHSKRDPAEWRRRRG